MNATPKTLPVKPDAIPSEMKAAPQWVLWRYVTRKGQPTKQPFQVDGRPASSTDPNTWTTFAKVLTAYQARPAFWAGVGFMFARGAGIVGADLDGVLDETTGDLRAEWPPEFIQACAGTPPAPAAIVAKLGSYAEVSPSGTGVKIFCRGDLPPGRRRVGNKTAGLEMYNEARFFAVTGHVLPGLQSTLADCNGTLTALHTAIFGAPRASKKTPTAKPDPSTTPTAFDESLDIELIECAKQAKNGAKFQKLWDGDTSDYPSASEADLALASILVFYCQGNAGHVEHLMRQSGLKRAKWDENKTYLRRTIAQAKKDKTEFYSGDAPAAATAAETEDHGYEGGATQVTMPKNFVAVKKPDLLRQLNEATIGKFGDRVEVVRVEKVGRQRGVFVLIDATGNAIRLGTIHEVNQIKKVQEAIQDATDVTILLNKRHWPTVVNAILKLAEVKDTGSLKECVAGWVRGYAETCRSYAATSNAKGAWGSKEWADEKYCQFGKWANNGILHGPGGELLLYLESFTRWVFSNRDPLVKPSEIKLELVALGFRGGDDGKRLTFEEKGSRKFVRAWVHPKWDEWV